MKMCKRLYTPKISLQVILHVVKQGPVLVHIKNKTLFVKRIYLVVRTSYDVFVKPTYALLRKEHLKTNHTIFFCETGPRSHKETFDFHTGRGCRVGVL